MIHLAAWTLSLALSAAADEASPLTPQYSPLPKREDAVAVVIGIDSYGDESIPHSDYSVDDAKAMVDGLQALGFRRSHIELLTNQMATGGGFRKALDHWLPDNVKPDSEVVFYYSGHGAPDVTTDPHKPEAYLMPFDGDPNYLSDTGYKVETLYDKLGKLKAKQVVIVLDSCFSGEGEHSVLAKGAKALVNQFSEPVGAIRSNMAVLTATTASGISASDKNVEHGVLTYNLLKAMSEGQTDVYQIYKNIKGDVEDEAKGAQHIDQKPQFLVASTIPKPEGMFFLADPNAIAAAKADYAKQHDESAKKAAAAAQQAAVEAALKQREQDDDAKLQERQRELDAQAAQQQEQIQQERQQQQQQIDEQRRELQQQQQNAAPDTSNLPVIPAF